jgi:hypothetical protein
MGLSIKFRIDRREKFPAPSRDYFTSLFPGVNPKSPESLEITVQFPMTTCTASQNYSPTVLILEIDFKPDTFQFFIPGKISVVPDRVI